MRKPVAILPLLSVLIAAFASGCGKEPAAPPVEQPKITIDPAELTAFAPLPDEVPSAAGAATAEMVTLGRMLYFEPRLSKSQKISCNTCQDLATYGVDNEPTSDGHKGQKGDRNSPTVFNAAAHFVQSWDGRAPDVEAQAMGPVMNPVEMAMPAEPVVVKVLESMPEYVDLFTRAFPYDKKPVSYDNMAKAIGAFERKLMTPSRWDKYLKGDKTALTPEEMARVQGVYQRRLPDLPRRRAAGRQLLPEDGRGEAVPALSRPGPGEGDQRRLGHRHVQGAFAA